MSVTVTVRDERTVRAPVPASLEETHAVVNAISEAALNGYSLAAAGTVTGGHQRDPYVTGIVLTFKKS